MNSRWIFWLVLWGSVGAGSFVAMQNADRAFTTYLGGHQPTMSAACRLLPKEVQVFAYCADFRQNWKALRSSEFYSAVNGLSRFREILSRWNLSESEWSVAERWVAQCWGPPMIMAYSPEKQTVYLLSPMGNREQGIRWLQKVLLSSERATEVWKPKKLGEGWCLEAAGAPFWPSGVTAQFHILNGVAVLAIGAQSDPLQDIHRTAESPESNLPKNLPGFAEFFETELQRAEQSPNASFGFVRLDKNPGTLGITWNLQIDGASMVNADVRVPTGTTSISPGEAIVTKSLEDLRQPDDFISFVAPLEEFVNLKNTVTTLVPPTWVEPFHAIKVESVPSVYRDSWKPIFDHFGNGVFIGLGDAAPLSEKFRVPFPRLVLGIPYTGRAAFLQALEATVLHCNEVQNANLLIRKISRPYGDYYEIKMGPSIWQQQHGLKELPVFAFTDDLLVVALTSDSMEKALEHLASKKESVGRETRGLDIQINMRTAPETIRILLAALGAFNPRGENIFLSPEVMNSMTEVFTLMEQFGNSRLMLTHEAGSIRLRAALRP